MQTQRGQIVVGLLVVAAVLAIQSWWLCPDCWGRGDHFRPGAAVPVSASDRIVEPGHGTNYTSVPPTSGDYWPRPAEPGVHERPIPDEMQVYNLRHGQILAQYTCADCPELAEQLAHLARRYHPWVIVAPYPDARVGARIALTAYGRIDRLDEFDEQRIIAFIEAHRNKGREALTFE
jgi:hypothetical protein